MTDFHDETGVGLFALDSQSLRYPDSAGIGQTLRSQPDPYPNAPKDEIHSQEPGAFAAMYVTAVPQTKNHGAGTKFQISGSGDFQINPNHGIWSKPGPYGSVRADTPPESIPYGLGCLLYASRLPKPP